MKARPLWLSMATIIIAAISAAALAVIVSHFSIVETKIDKIYDWSKAQQASVFTVIAAALISLATFLYTYFRNRSDTRISKISRTIALYNQYYEDEYLRARHDV